jgi:sporulation protein YunB
MLPNFRGRFPRRGPLPIKYVILITIFFFVLSTTFGLWIVNRGIKPTLLNYAEMQTKKIATLVLNNAITKKIQDETSIQDFIQYVQTENGVGMYSVNTQTINRIQADVVNLVQMNLKKVEQGNIALLETLIEDEIDFEALKNEEGVVFKVPLGQATNNAILGNIGPKIPIRFTLIGNVVPEISLTSKQVGINNTWVEAFIHLKINMQIIIPFATTITTIEQDILAGSGLIPGEVPQFYSGQNGVNPSIEVPTNRN